MTNSGDALVVVPTYNERDNIGEVIRRLLTTTGEEVHLLIVDDSSPDGTSKVAGEVVGDNERAAIVERPRKGGLASAYVDGFKWALERGYNAIVEMDGDLSHDPSAVPQLLAALADADLVIGSRYISGGRIINWGRFRQILSRAGNLYARWWLGWRVMDSTSGFRAYRAEVLAAEELSTLHSEGYAFQIEMTHRVHRAGHRIKEIPITFTERRAGQSKLSRAVVLEAIWRVPLWAMKNRRTRTTGAN